ncbi:MAG: DNA-binding protein [Ignavibacteriae bacterium]|nr:DNA-binding protein [Ignavibacteriota bacterium]MCB9214888.1 DNA-binding protein [Ignavibacteria bacterium]
MKRTVYTTGRTFVGRLPSGVDLLESLTRIANDEEIKVGRVEVFGSLSTLSLSTLNQETRFSETLSFERGYEIGSLAGTISLFKRRSLPRLSGVFADNSGNVVAGILALGTIVYACEVVLTELTGGSLSRDFDIETGLPLWKNGLILENQADQS